jgi:phage terminase large subunit-like protein
VLVLAGEDDTIELVPYFWIPEGRLTSRKEQQRLQGWVREGLITATPGNVIDYQVIRAHWQQIAKNCRVQQIGFDPWNSTQFALELGEQDGLKMIEVRQGVRTLHEPTKKLLDLVASGKLRHGGHPVLRWMAQNFAVRLDVNGNYMPDKVRSAEKIDGLVAAIIGLSRQMVAPVQKPRQRRPCKIWTPGGFKPILGEQAEANQ